MTALTAIDRGVAAEEGGSLLRLGVVVWLASELMFFAGLFAAYFGVRGQAADWPPPGTELETARTAAATGVLVLSSVTYHQAARAAERGDRLFTGRWTIVTAILGVVFLSNQALEYAQTDLRFGRQPYDSLFFLLTGIHGVHVAGGLILMAAVLGVRSTARFGDVVGASVAYWHFVDVIWLAMFTTLYLVR